MLEANKKHVSLKSYSLKIGINSVNQIWRNKERVNLNINILTTITDQKIPCANSYLLNTCCFL